MTMAAKVIYDKERGIAAPTDTAHTKFTMGTAGLKTPSFTNSRLKRGKIGY